MGLNVGVYVKKDVLILRLKGELDDLSVSDLRMRISKYISDYSIVHLVINVKDLNFWILPESDLSSVVIIS